MNDDSRAEIEVKINRLLDDELSRSDRASLERELLCDPEAQAMLRDYGALDEQCRDALSAVLAEGAGPTTGARGTPRRRLLVAAAVAAAAVLAVALWSAFHEPSEGPGRNVVGRPDNTTPRPSRTVEMMVDQFDPAPPAAPSARPVRCVDRFPVGLFDVESGQIQIFRVDREQRRIQPVGYDL